MKLATTCVLLAASWACCVNALDNGLARTPPMGFNPWNVFGTTSKGTPKLPGSHGFNLSVMVDVAQAMKDKGFAAAGYKYVNLDCGWSTGFRGSDGLITVNTTRYPGGLEAYVKAINDVGLEAGLYLDAGPTQCCSRVYPGANDGSLGHEAVDAKWMVDLGFKWLKYDSCGSQPQSYGKMRDGLNATGSKIILSVHGPTKAGAVNVSNIWRATPDITNDWDTVIDRAKTTSSSITASPGDSAPGSFATADMLEAFNGTPESPGLTDTESRTHFAIWCALKSPLVLGFDVAHASDAAVEALTNPGIIAINQDPLGEPAIIRNETSTGLWFGGRLSNSRGVVVIASVAPGSEAFTLSTLAVPGWPAAQEAVLTDAWTGKELGKTTNGEWKTTIASHDHVAVILSR